MRPKSTAQIQLEIALMRLAYQDRQTSERLLNQPRPLSASVIYLISIPAAAILTIALYHLL